MRAGFIHFKESSRPFGCWAMGQRHTLVMNTFAYRSHRLLTHFVSFVKPYARSSGRVRPAAQREGSPPYSLNQCYAGRPRMFGVDQLSALAMGAMPSSVCWAVFFGNPGSLNDLNILNISSTVTPGRPLAINYYQNITYF
jgi:hypothetical protein